MPEDIKTSGLNHKKQRQLIEKVRKRIKKHPVVKKMFKDFDVDIEEIDLIPMCFAETDVSARTDHGVIYFSTKLRDDGDFENDDHYMVHEITHYLQQTTGKKPTQGADEGEYLENPDEIEGFQYQVEYIDESRDEEAADQYVNQVLDHHDYTGKKREEKEEELKAKSSIIERMKKLSSLFKNSGDTLSMLKSMDKGSSFDILHSYFQKYNIDDFYDIHSELKAAIAPVVLKYFPDLKKQLHYRNAASIFDILHEVDHKLFDPEMDLESREPSVGGPVQAVIDEIVINTLSPKSLDFDNLEPNVVFDEYSQMLARSLGKDDLTMADHLRLWNTEKLPNKRKEIIRRRVADKLNKEVNQGNIDPDSEDISVLSDIVLSTVGNSYDIFQDKELTKDDAELNYRRFILEFEAVLKRFFEEENYR